MTDPQTADTGERYDRLASGYAEFWGPVIAPAALTVLDAANAFVGSRTARILDLGTGTGTLAHAAADRWPSARVVGIDPSDGMLAVARARADGTATGRLDFIRAFADALPFADESFDLVVSSFVLQLVPNRYRALREARRVLRPGGSIVFITWLSARDDVVFKPDAVFDDVLEAFELDGPGADPHPGDVPSVDAAVRQTRRAGFRAVEARPGMVRHQYDADSYVAFLERFDEEDLFASLGDTLRDRVRAELLGRLRALPDEDLVLQLPTVLVQAARD